MALNKVEICGVNTARLPILTNEEKDALFIQIRQGDAEAREQFIKGNLRLVLSVIRRFSSAASSSGVGSGMGTSNCPMKFRWMSISCTRSPLLRSGAWTTIFSTNSLSMAGVSAEKSV